jgi:hypothetical protein
MTTDILALYAFAWLCHLDREDHLVANASIAALRAAQHLENAADLGSGVVRYNDDG